VKLNDAVWGALLVALGVALVVVVQGFPRIPGQQIGPGLFPGLLGIGLAVCGLILAIRALLARRRAGGARAAWVELPEWSRSPRHLLAFAALVAVNLLYLLAADRLGFIVTGSIYLAALMAVLRVPLRRLVPLALVLTLAIHFAFYKLLRVPLPWGVLQPIAW
jgi:putative tricarboxylic transport membrane protein